MTTTASDVARSPGALPTIVASTPMVASTPPGPVMRTTPSHLAPLVQLARHLHDEHHAVPLSTVAELTAAAEQMSTMRQQSEAEERAGGSGVGFFDVEDTFETAGLDGKRWLS